MDKLFSVIRSIHVPSIVLAFIAALGLQLSITLNGSPVDVTTNEGRANLIMAVLIVLLKTIQMAPAVKNGK